MRSDEIRKIFLEYFEKKGHKIVKSSSLIPHNDPTLLFTNAGMNQFKNVFLGIEKRDYKRATSSQKCMRAGGKHNDLEQVGKTERHHTFFEMLGNFSFGDYFKKEAIEFAWELLTDVYKIPEERLFITIYEEDEEAFNIWNKVIGIPEEKIFRLGKKDNFWEMGETGPCGPCTEIHYQLNPNGAKSIYEDESNFLEVWNIVFMQYSRDESGKLNPLPSPSIDTGMGLERLTAIIQGVNCNFKTDLFTPIISALEEETGKEFEEDEKTKIAMRVIADHLRAITFLIADGVLPSNDGRGYVLRRIIRRAERFGKDLGLNEPFLYKLTSVVIDTMKNAYPELLDSKYTISDVTKFEEERFKRTLDIGYQKLKELIEKAKKEGKSKIHGKEIFRLYDTYGFPQDISKDILEEEGFTFDEKEFESAMENQKQKARAHWKGEEKFKEIEKYKGLEKIKVEFTGYESLREEAEIITLYKNGEKAKTLKEGDEGEIIVFKTPFYGEAGGQVGDKGIIYNENFLSIVVDTKKPGDNLIVHIVKVKRGEIKVGDKVNLEVDKELRWNTAKNHTATHLLHKALKEVLGAHVKQAGSLVAPERLRFDFTHFTKLTAEEIRIIEDIVNRKIQENIEVKTSIMEIEEAIKSGATAIFEEKYGDIVRVVEIGDFSKELCGGTHLKRTGDIGVFKIISEESVSAGVRRIEALTGEKAVVQFQKYFSTVEELKKVLNVDEEKIVETIKSTKNSLKEMEKELKRIKEKEVFEKLSKNAQNSMVIGKFNVLFSEVKELSKEQMRNLSDNLKNKMKSGIVFLWKEKDGKLSIIINITKDIAEKISAKKLIKEIAPLIRGGGGGRDDFVEAGGSNPDGIKSAIEKIKSILLKESE